MLNRLKSILLIDCEALAGSDFLLCAIFGGAIDGIDVLSVIFSKKIDEDEGLSSVDKAVGKRKLLLWDVGIGSITITRDLWYNIRLQANTIFAVSLFWYRIPLDFRLELCYTLD